MTFGAFFERTFRQNVFVIACGLISMGGVAGFAVGSLLPSADAAPGAMHCVVLVPAPPGGGDAGGSARRSAPTLTPPP